LQNKGILIIIEMKVFYQKIRRMSISRAECHDTLEQQFLRDFSQINNISKLTSTSW
jgi:hypothetical protein